MKYIPISYNINNTNSICRHNLRKALIRIGELNPLEIKDSAIRKWFHVIKGKKHYLGCGILNVRKKINKNLGKNGKFRNQMIKKMLLSPNKSDFKINSDSKETIKVCQDMFVPIAKAIFELLNRCDSNYATELFECTNLDEAITLRFYDNGDSIKVSVPMQAFMVISSSPNSNLCNMIKEELGNVKYPE